MMTPDNDSDLLSEAFDRDSRDSGADTAAPEAQPRAPDGTFAPKDAAAPPEPPAQQQAQPEAQAPPPQPTDKRSHRVPLHELEAEREKRKAIEAAKTEAEARAQVYERELQQLRAQQAQQRQPQRQQVPPPDPMTEPAEFAQYQQAMFNQQIMNERANFSEMRARDKFGDQAVEAALQAAPESIRQAVLQRPDPYGELIKWHKQASFITKVGPDPEAYEKSIEQRVRESVLAELKAGKLQLNGQAPPQQRFPGTLADNPATGAQTAHLSDEAMMAGVYARR